MPKKKRNKFWNGMQNVGKQLSDLYWKVNNSNYVQGLKARENQSNGNAFMPKDLIQKEEVGQESKEKKEEKKNPWATDFSNNNEFATKL